MIPYLGLLACSTCNVSQSPCCFELQAADNEKLSLRKCVGSCLGSGYVLSNKLAGMVMVKPGMLCGRHTSSLETSDKHRENSRMDQRICNGGTVSRSLQANDVVKWYLLEGCGHLTGVSSRPGQSKGKTSKWQP